MARTAAATESGRLGAASDLAVTMGCGETCPNVPGARYFDWPLDDPKGQDDATVRRIVADTDTRVRDLSSSWFLASSCLPACQTATEQIERFEPENTRWQMKMLT